MKLHIPPILTFLSVVIVVSHASLPPEIYWKQVLPYTDMPKSIRAILPKREYMASKNTVADIGKGRVHVNTGHGGGGTTVNMGLHSGVGVTTGKGHTNVGVGEGGVRVNANKLGPKKKLVYAKVKYNTANKICFKYVAATEAQLNDKPTRDVFMVEKDLRPGYQTSLRFTQSNSATFLPRQVADSIPFSSNEMSKILQEFSIDPNSNEAKVVKQTVNDCARKSIKEEYKYCATSLESMVDHVTSTLGKNVKVVSTETNEKSNKVEKYVISGVRKIANEDETEVCHKQNYAYAVFYCHNNKHTTAYMVSLMGEDGSKVKAVTICHKDTSGWNPRHLAFQVLKVKPGSVPVCHFLPEDHILWVRN